MFPQNYTLELVFSAILTFAVLAFAVRLYLKFIGRPSGISKPDWMSDEEFESKFGKKK